MRRRAAVLTVAMVTLAACGSSGSNVAIFDAGAPSATLSAQPAFLEAESTSEDTAVSSTGSGDSLAAEATSSPATSAAPTSAAPTIAPFEPAVIDPAPVPTLLPEEQPAAATFDLAGCPETPRGAVADKEAQRYWLCADGQAVTDAIPMTTASGNYGLPPVGTYPVFARDAEAYGIGGESLERFVAFYTTPRGNRIAFHEVVNQDPTTVGDLDQRGASAGCFRVREDDSIEVWDFLQIDDPVVVIT